MKRLCLFLLALWWPLVASAEWRVVGNGYYLWYGASGSDGWYYTKTCTQPYWYCGKYYAGTCSYVRAYQVPVASSVTYSANWKSDLLKAVERQKDSQLFIQALRESGLQAPTATTLVNGENITTVKGTQVYQSGYYYPHAEQGTTLVGLKEYAPNIGQVDLSGNLNQVQRVLDQTLKLADNMAYDLSGHIGQITQGQLELAKIQSAGKVAVALAQASSPPKQVTTQFEAQAGASSGTSRASATTAPPGPLPPDPAGPPQNGALARIEIQQMFNQACIKCHSTEKAKAGLDLSQFDKWGDDQLAEYGPKIAARIISHDAEFQMPPPDSGIKPLSPLEIKKVLAVVPVQ